MNKPESTWIKIGQAENARSLRNEAKKLKRAWPDRWEFMVLPTKADAEPSFDLYLRHR